MTNTNTDNTSNSNNTRWVSIRLAFLLVSFSLGQLGDGLNIFQGIYLVGRGWNEASVGTALSLMGLTSLCIQPIAGDVVDKATMDRRWFLVVASVVTALSASAILFVRPGNVDHAYMYASKVAEGCASSFIGPCLAALTLASYGPDAFDSVMASNIFWGHVGSVSAAVLAGLVAFVGYPNIQYCFLVIGASALVAIVFVPSLPQGDPLLGRGFRRHSTVETTTSSDDTTVSCESTPLMTPASSQDPLDDEPQQPMMQESPVVEPQATSYAQVFLEYKTCLLCCTGFFFHFANANVLLVLGELMGQSNDDQDDESSSSLNRWAIPFTAGAIVMAQLTMAWATHVGDALTARGVGRKPLFLAALASLPIRCALIILWADQGHVWLLSTQVLDGIGGGLFGLIHPLLVADLSYGTGRFNAVMGLTASAFGLGATLSNYLGQVVVQHFGHVASLTASLCLSFIPIALFWHMPETYGRRNEQTRMVETKTLIV